MSRHSLAIPTLEPNSPEESLLERLNAYFEMKIADSPELVREAQRIRYHVYCLETRFENADEHPDRMEKDEFDSHAVHGLLFHRASGLAVGTVRLVLPWSEAPERSFAIQQVTEHPILKDPAKFPLFDTAEVSRFCISRQFRRRAADTLYDQAENGTGMSPSGERRSGPLMRLGLIQVLIRMTIQHGITHWCAVMEPSLLRMLDTMAIRFSPVGSAVDYHGLRQPCICKVPEMLRSVRRERPRFWEALTAGGTLLFPREP